MLRVETLTNQTKVTFSLFVFLLSFLVEVGRDNWGKQWTYYNIWKGGVVHPHHWSFIFFPLMSQKCWEVEVYRNSKEPLICSGNCLLNCVVEMRSGFRLTVANLFKSRRDIWFLYWFGLTQLPMQVKNSTGIFSCFQLKVTVSSMRWHTIIPQAVSPAC